MNHSNSLTRWNKTEYQEPNVFCWWMTARFRNMLCHTSNRSRLWSHGRWSIKGSGTTRRDENFDIIISDIEMPDMNGYDFATKYAPTQNGKIHQWLSDIPQHRKTLTTDTKSGFDKYIAKIWSWHIIKYNFKNTLQRSWNMTNTSKSRPNQASSTSLGKQKQKDFLTVWLKARCLAFQFTGSRRSGELKVTKIPCPTSLRVTEFERSYCHGHWRLNALGFHHGRFWQWKRMGVVVNHDDELYSLIMRQRRWCITYQKILRPNPATLDIIWKSISLGVYRLDGKIFGGWRMFKALIVSSF